MANGQHPTHPALTSDDITHFRRVIAGGPGNERQTLTVEVVSLVDEGQASPPILTTHGNLDMAPDQVDEIADALREARTAWHTAHTSWIEGLR